MRSRSMLVTVCQIYIIDLWQCLLTCHTWVVDMLYLHTNIHHLLLVPYKLL